MQKNLDKVLKDISSGKTAPVYLLFGEDGYFVNEAFKKLLDSFVPEEDRSLNLEIFKGEKLDLDAVIIGLSSYPFLAGHKVVALLDQEMPASTSPDFDLLLECLEKNIPPQNHLIIATSKTVDKRTVLFKKIKEIGEIFAFEEEDARDRYSSFRDKINERVTSEGKKITGEAFDSLIDRTGFDARLIFAEIEKLLNFAGDKKIIDKSDVDAVVPVTRQQVIFTLLDAMSRRDKKIAFDILERLLSEGEEPIKINHMMARQIRLLLQAKELLETEHLKKFNENSQFPLFQKLFGNRIEEFRDRYKEDSYNLFSYKPFYVFNVSRLASKWDKESLLKSFKFLHHADMDLKSSGNEQGKLILQKLILNLGQE